MDAATPMSAMIGTLPMRTNLPVDLFIFLRWLAGFKTKAVIAHRYASIRKEYAFFREDGLVAFRRFIGQNWKSPLAEACPPKFCGRHAGANISPALSQTFQSTVGNRARSSGHRC